MIKKKLILLGAILMFSFCSSKHDELNYKKILLGKWLNKEYMDLIKINKSPFNTFQTKIANQIISIEYLPENNNNKLLISYLHEGDNYSFTITDLGEVLIRSSENQRPIFTAELLFTDQDTSLNLKLNKRNERIKFEKTNQNLERFIDSSLFSGHYRFYDLVDNIETDVSFKDGIVKGFHDFDKYFIMYDYNDDIPQYDIIKFSYGENQVDWFSYKINQDTLNLYEFDQPYLKLDYESISKNSKKYSFIRIK